MGVFEAQFVPEQPTKVFDQSTTIQHWQLRDLVHAHGEQDLFFVRDNRTLQLDVAAGSSEVAQSLSFAPTAMTAREGYVVAGGQNSWLDVRRIKDGELLFRDQIGGSVNNALHIAHLEGQLRLLVCNNDHTVKLFDLPSMRHLQTLTCPVAVNYAALSPDGRHLAAVGDANETYLFRATPSGFVEEATFSEYDDAGMACTWSPSGACLAAGSQDGHVVLWDSRSYKVCARLRTVHAACRCLKFGEGPADLMAFSEHSDLCHLVDTRAFQERQVLDLSAGCEGSSDGGGLEEGCDISGLSFTPSGRRLYVGLEGVPGQGIAAFDVKMLSRLTFGAAQLN